MTRLDEEPVSKTGMGCEALGRSSRPASALTPRWSSWSRRRALNPETGVRFPVAIRNAMPGSRAERRPAVTRKAGVRAPPWQPLARWPIRCEGMGILRQALPAGLKARCKPDGKRRHLLFPAGSRIDSPVVVVQRTGSGHATLAMRVRLPPTTHIHHHCRRGPEGRTLGSYPRGSGFDPRHRLHREMQHAADEGREPDRDGTALIPRDDVVRLHDALPNRATTTSRSVADRLSLQGGSRGFESLLVDCGRGLKWSRRRVVTPEEAGSSPVGHPAHMTACGDLEISGPHTPCCGFDPALATRAGGAIGSAAPLQGEGCGFESRTVHRRNAC